MIDTKKEPFLFFFKKKEKKNKQPMLNPRIDAFSLSLPLPTLEANKT